MRILITEEALQTGNGHWPNYIGGIAEGLRSAGDDVDVLVHRNATDAVMDQVGGTRWFSRNCWLDPASQGALGGVRHNLRFRRELAGWLDTHEPYDWVCALTMRLQHLLAFALMARRQPRITRINTDGGGKAVEGRAPRVESQQSLRCPQSNISNSTFNIAAKRPPAAAAPRFLLLFVQGFGRFAGHGMPTVFPVTASTLLARFCFWLMSPAVRNGSVVLAAETKGMQDELQRFTSLPVRLFPHPVQISSSSSPSVSLRCDPRLKI